MESAEKDRNSIRDKGTREVEKGGDMSSLPGWVVCWEEVGRQSW